MLWLPLSLELLSHRPLHQPAAAAGEATWLLAGLVAALAFAALSCAWDPWGCDRRALLRVLPYHSVPAAAALLWNVRRSAYLRHREALWLLQRLAITLAASLPGSPVFVLAARGGGGGGSSWAQQLLLPLWSFGVANVLMEAVIRRVRAVVAVAVWWKESGF